MVLTPMQLHKILLIPSDSRNEL